MRDEARCQDGLEKSIFIDLKEQPRIVPLRPWPKDKHLEIGRLSASSLK